MKYALLILAFTSLPLFAEARIEFCDYDKSSGDFIVFADGVKHRKSMDGGFWSGVVSCSSRIAAAYDGDDLYVFDDREKSFERTGMIDDGYEFSVLVTNNDAALFYDGDDLYVYAADKGSFDRTSLVDDGVTNAVAASGRNGFLFYDGDDLVSFCGGRFDRSFMVDDGAEAFELGDGRVAALRVGDDSFFLDEQCRIQRF